MCSEEQSSQLLLLAWQVVPTCSSNLVVVVSGAGAELQKVANVPAGHVRLVLTVNVQRLQVHHQGGGYINVEDEQAKTNDNLAS